MSCVVGKVRRRKRERVCEKIVLYRVCREMRENAAAKNSARQAVQRSLPTRRHVLPR